MEKKRKIFYLDFIRVISMFIIVTYHFFVHFSENNIVGTDFIFSNGKWGLIGVTLFFMISGAALMYNYKEKLELKQYAKKRFLGIYPMFWIAYTSLFIYFFYMNKQNIWGLPMYRLIFSLFAMDGYLSPYIQTIYLIGEWFLGCIVLIYVVFPLLRKAVLKWPKITFTIGTILNFLLLIFYTNGKMEINKNIIVCLYSFMLGMYVINIKKIKIGHAGIGLLIAIAGYMMPSATRNVQVLFGNMVGYGLFFVLAYIGQFVQNMTIQKIFGIISKYSYAIFLVHHYIIMSTENKFQNRTYGFTGTLLLYITCWSIIAIFAKLLFMVNKGVLDVFKNDEKKVKDI